MTPDTDIFVVPMYNLKNTWKDLGLYLLKKGEIIIPQKPEQDLYNVPLHLLLSKLDPKVIKRLPAGHVLTGCDTVTKEGTKLFEICNGRRSASPIFLLSHVVFTCKLSSCSWTSPFFLTYMGSTLYL